MKLLITLIFSYLTISCTQNKLTNERDISSLPASCFEKGTSTTDMWEKFKSGECNDLARFCDESSLWWVHQYDGINRDGPLYKYENISKAYYNNEAISIYDDRPWDNSMIPTEYSRKKSIFDNYDILDNSFSIDSYDLNPISENDKLLIKEIIKEKFNNYTQQSDVQEMNKTSNRTFICALLLKFDILNFNDCQKAILSTTEHVNQREGFTLPKEYNTLHTSDSYIRPLHRVAKKIIKYIRAGQAPKSDIFSDLYSEFKKDLSEKEAIEHTWTTIAILANGGANYKFRAKIFKFDKSNSTIYKTLSLIVQSLPLLSHWGRTNNSFYGLPKSVQVGCDNGKHYHFWLSSYLTWLAVQNGHTQTGAAAAVYSIFKGYTYISESGGREPHLGFSLDSFHGYNNIQRIDMAYSAAGVRFALNFLNGKTTQPINMDKATVEIFKKSKNTDKLERSKTLDYMKSQPQKAFLSWMERFAPDVPYNILVKGQ